MCSNNKGISIIFLFSTFCRKSTIVMYLIQLLNVSQVLSNQCVVKGLIKVRIKEALFAHLYMFNVNLMMF